MNSSTHRTPADVLRQAADYIERNGYRRPYASRDNFGRGRGLPPASDVGAITYVIYGAPLPLPEAAPDAEFALYRRAVNAYVDLIEVNDGVEQYTQAGVVADLRHAADLWDRNNLGVAS